MQLEISTKELAELKGCSQRNIKQLAQSGKLCGKIVKNKKNRPAYQFAVAGLDPALQVKYYRQHGLDLPPELRKSKKAQPVKASKPLDAYTAAQRDEISRWITIVQDWQAYRSPRKDKDTADAEYITQCRIKHPDVRVSRDILYSRQRAYKANDYDGLIDKRGMWRKGSSSFPSEIKDLFLWMYLDERALPISKCYEATRLEIERQRPELMARMPSYDTMYRWTREFSKPVACLAREGDKAFNDRYGIFVDRFYDDMSSNDYWIADGHTIDVISKADDGSERHHRMTLSAFIDARSGIYVGWVVTDHPSSDATIFALRKAIQRYGIPKNIYVDNGREYLNIDIGGTGHRRTSKVKIDLPTPILQRLGIQMTNALPRNAQAKIIEREFKNFTFLSRLFDTYCGSNVVAKPEKLKRKLKAGNIPTDGELTQVVNEMIDGYFNCQVYNGKVVGDRGKTKMQVYNDHLPQAIRRAAPDDLYLMMMRSTRAQTVRKNGVYLTVCGERIYYHSDDLLLHWSGKKVYLRYDPEDLSTVRVYDVDEKYVMTVPVISELMLDYGASKDDVRTAMQQKRRWRNQAKHMADIQREQAVSQYGPLNVLDIFVRAAHVNNEGLLLPSDGSTSNITEITPAPQSDRARAAVGDDGGVVIDIQRMIRNREAKERR